MASAAKSIAALIVISGLVWLWNEAHKELVFLCGNFKPGAGEQSVNRQLATAQFLGFRKESTGSTERIVASSMIHLGIHACVIDLNHGIVKQARIE